LGHIIFLELGQVNKKRVPCPFVYFAIDEENPGDHKKYDKTGCKKKYPNQFIDFQKNML
jgi:hypothetical protein